MRPDYRTDTVDTFFIRFQIGVERRVDRLFERSEPERDGNHLGAENFHPRDVRRLFCDIDFAHVGSGGRQRHPVLTGARFGDETFLPHKMGQKTFSHAVVQFMGAGMV